MSKLPDEILNYCQRELGQVKNFTPASGGCINNGGLVEAESARAFIKWNSASRFPNMFEVEAKGLSLLKKAHSLFVPSVLGDYEGKEFSGLLIEYIEPTSRKDNFWENFGEGLARLHKQSSGQFGLDHNNYMGSLEQLNDNRDTIVEFFRDCRLQPQIDLAKRSNKIDKEGFILFDKLFDKLSDLLVEEYPSLVHGDLWSGNFMTGPQGYAALIDPAVAFNHREADLAMTQLFGGFDPKFYEAYQADFPLSPGYQERFDIFNLYPLLVHVNLFGGGYYNQVMHTLKRYI
ncbi:ketosamine-3-kinase [Fulvivirga sp. RKSG066]|uniref:fructosamine kinase family protein n=1 Tax=Fulvivirga aurantia TaxID=2529383 RepID=UPI0012BD2C86|nr:fructosamine kinase family protein [Fulvivirga aurantia]MTI22662.1 ketosamine-3-kinase [Fulvivirga aurantia]